MADHPYDHYERAYSYEDIIPPGIDGNARDEERIHVADPAVDKPPPGPSRDDLLVSAWLKRELPPRDYLMGEVMCTTSRWTLIGQTGAGKTLFSLDLAGAMAAGADFLGWEGRRRCRVMYLDGELPAETFKERIQLVAERYGDDIELFGYNRDVLGPDEMPPLNTEPGRAWLWREIETVKPDAIFFDAIMCLTIGNMSEEESWAPMKDLVRQITARRIAQVWLHHTGHDATKGYGTKTREWEMDTVAIRSKAGDEEDEETATKFQLEFTKTRMRTPANFKQYATKTVTCTEAGFSAEDGKCAQKAKGSAEAVTLRKAFKDAYTRLADSVSTSPGFDGAPVRKVGVDALRAELKSRGFLDVDDKGRVTAAARQAFSRVKGGLLATGGGFVELDGFLWRI